MDEVLLYFSLKYQGDFDRQYLALQMKEPIDQVLFDELKSKLNSNYITILDERYPDSLKAINYPPFVLYYKGDLSLLDTKSVSMIGMRNPSEYGLKEAEHLSGYLANKNITVISGLTAGIDTKIHETCIDHQSKTITVMPCGIDYCYPSANQELYEQLCKDHLVISEYPYDIKPRKDYFPKRNRLITGLGEKLVVVESLRKGSAMISVGFALEQNKDVLCVPHPMGEKDGCNYLISLGAKPILDESDLLRDRNGRELDKNQMLDVLSNTNKNRQHEI